MLLAYGHPDIRLDAYQSADLISWTEIAESPVLVESESYEAGGLGHSGMIVNSDSDIGLIYHSQAAGSWYFNYVLPETTMWDFAGTNHGDLKGEPEDILGVMGQAQRFDGVGAYIEVGDLDLIGPYTLSAHIRPSGITSDGWYVVVEKQYQYTMGVRRIGTNMRFFANIGTSTGDGWQGDIFTADNSVSNDVWYDLVSRFDGTTHEVIVNGSSDASASRTTNADNAILTKVGLGGASNYFLGDIDEVALFSDALTDQEIIYEQNYTDYTFRFNTTEPSTVSTGPTWYRGDGQTMGAAVNSSSTAFTINVTTWATNNIAWDSYATGTITTRYNFTLATDTSYPYFVDGVQEGSFTTDASGEGSFDWTSWTIHQFEVGQSGEDPGGGGPGAPKILLTTATAYFGWNSVLLSADAIVEKSGGPDPDEVLFYRWDMGDGTIRTGPEVSHSYSLRWFWSVYDVTLDVCTAQESVCETRTIPIVIVFWPAVYGLIIFTLAILILLARKARWRIVSP